MEGRGTLLTDKDTFVTDRRNNPSSHGSDSKLSQNSNNMNFGKSRPVQNRRFDCFSCYALYIYSIFCAYTFMWT